MFVRRNGWFDVPASGNEVGTVSDPSLWSSEVGQFIAVVASY